MSIKTILFLLWVVFAAQLSAQKSLTYSDVSDSLVIIDGNPSEWRQPFRYYDGASKLEFSFRNDSLNLYLCIKVADELAQIKMLNSGLEFSINISKKRVGSITFPFKRELSSTQPPELLNQDQTRRHDRGAIKRLLIGELKNMEVKGFKNLPDGIYSLQIPEGIKTAIGIDTLGVLTAEYQVPLNMFFIKTDIAKPVTALITLNGTELPTGGGMRGPKNGEGSPPDGDGGGGPQGNMGGGGMGGGPPGGGMGGGMGGGAMDGRGSSGQSGPPPGFAAPGNDNAQDKIIKMKLKLAAW